MTFFILLIKSCPIPENVLCANRADKVRKWRLRKKNSSTVPGRYCGIPRCKNSGSVSISDIASETALEAYLPVVTQTFALTMSAGLRQ